MGTTLCELCRVHPAAYVCTDCGRKTCSRHFDEDRWICNLCEEKARRVEAIRSPTAAVGPRYLWVVSLGVALTFIGVAILIASSLAKGIPTEGAGLMVLFIGPIPIVFGGSSDPTLLLPLGFLVFAMALLAYFMVWRRL